MKKITIILFILSFFCNLSFAQDDLSFSAKVDKTSIDISEFLTITFEIIGNFKQSPKLEIPQLNDFVTVAKNSSSFALSKGEVKSTIKIELVLKAKKTGDLEIPECEIKYKKEIFKTDKIKINITGKLLQEPNQDESIDEAEITL
ncbi:MAG: BatD family protein [Candidatus Gygaella obscura]|nr:BatD family protein [Candidatus Gygaella obscura]